MEKLIKIKIDDVILEGMLVLPEETSGLVIFAHGSDSSRLSPRNNFVATVLQKNKIGTLLIDLLTEQEDEVYETRFNIPLLTDRLAKITSWVKDHPETKNLPIGLFGASTGAAAALKTAARMKNDIAAVVSRGGRPDMAIDELENVIAPTLLIVGGEDTEVIELNSAAFIRLKEIKTMEIIPGATHLFEEPGTLEQVATLATEWFKKYLIRP
ncbi:dienelactone hydrolase family protein [Candidatus Roizmanbacteria bacterium]|nr:dienelactone hydrolase family protein [Candidatus Roizmanbacteria bacterium]